MPERYRNDHRALLEDHLLFSSLPSEGIDKILSNSLIRHYPKNSTIFVRGEDGDRLFAILQGRVKISIFSEEGREIVLAVMRTGDFFGEIAFLDGHARTADATAVEDCEILSIGRGDFYPILEGHPDIYRKIIMVLCERLRQTNEAIEDSIFLTVPARVAKTLIKLSSSYGEKRDDGKIYFNIKISQQELANIIGTSREVVNRHLRHLQSEGVIRMEQGYLVIEEPDYLTEFTHN